MKLSLMLLNPALPVFMEKDFTPKKSVSEEDYEALYSLAQEAGYEAVDLSVMEIEHFGAPRVKALLEKHHLRCASLVLFEDYTNPQAAPMEHTRAVIRAASVIGCETVMLVAAVGRKDIPRRVMHKTMIGFFREAVSYAAPYGIRIAIEDFPSTLVPMCSIVEVRELLKQVPGLGLVYDTINMLAMGEEPMAYHEAFKDRICYYHLKDAVITEAQGDLMKDGRYLQAVLTGEGLADLREVILRAGKNGYTGYLSVEYAPRGEEWAHHAENVRKAKDLLEAYIREV